jgi:predicted dehydrogenase
MRIGLVGTGHWAVRTAGAALTGHPDAKLVGVYGRDPAKTRSVGAGLGVPAFTDVDGLIAGADAVAFAVPPDVQAELAVRAAVAGRHLLLDKPLALSEAAADRVVAAVEDAGVASLVFFTRRFQSTVDEFLTWAAARAWEAARITMFASIFQPDSPYGASPWRRERGGLWDIGPHALSVVLPVLGPVAEVAALAGPRDATHALLRHASGAVTSLALTLDAPPGGTLAESVLYGADGPVPVPVGDGTAVAAYTVAVSQLAANVEAGVTNHPCDVRFGLDVVNLLARIERARR